MCIVGDDVSDLTVGVRQGLFRPMHCFLLFLNKLPDVVRNESFCLLMVVPVCSLIGYSLFFLGNYSFKIYIINILYVNIVSNL